MDEQKLLQMTATWRTKNGYADDNEFVKMYKFATWANNNSMISFFEYASDASAGELDWSVDEVLEDLVRRYNDTGDVYNEILDEQLDIYKELEELRHHSMVR